MRKMAYGINASGGFRIKIRRNHPLRFFYTELRTEGIRGFLAGSDDRFAFRKLQEQCADIGRLHNFQEFVGSIILQAAYGRSRIKSAIPFSLRKSMMRSLQKAFSIHSRNNPCC